MTCLSTSLIPTDPPHDIKPARPYTLSHRLRKPPIESILSIMGNVSDEPDGLLN
jgi:hypothetical protein